MTQFHYPDLPGGGYHRVESLPPGDFFKCCVCHRFQWTGPEIWCCERQSTGIWPVCRACQALGTEAVRKRPRPEFEEEF